MLKIHEMAISLLRIVMHGFVHQNNGTPICQRLRKEGSLGFIRDQLTSCAWQNWVYSRSWCGPVLKMIAKNPMWSVQESGQPSISTHTLNCAQILASRRHFKNIICFGSQRRRILAQKPSASQSKSAGSPLCHPIISVTQRRSSLLRQETIIPTITDGVPCQSTTWTIIHTCLNDCKDREDPFNVMPPKTVSASQWSYVFTFYSHIYCPIFVKIDEPPAINSRRHNNLVQMRIIVEILSQPHIPASSSNSWNL